MLALNLVMQRMNAAVCELGGNAGLRRIVAPSHPRIVGVCCIGVVPVREFGDDESDFSQLATRNHRAHMPDQ